MVLNEQIGLLEAKVVRLRNLRNLLKNSTLFRNWEGTCPSELDAQVRCFKITGKKENNCLCWSTAEVKVNWFTANAFCDYHGMHLISFPSNVVGDKADLATLAIWTSASDVITRRAWVFRNGAILSKQEAYQSKTIAGLDELLLKNLEPIQNGSYPNRNLPTTCISANITDSGTKLTFYPESCLENRPFVCEQFIL
ncbi:hypothetical protein GHT06_010063 [Daphnia sinensis]|uniref:C-type lectin domain-containing protein n=1 Tax=Daphnia sinensis TaxID=1820382 RepID=A0AAD5KXJ7_9CRUS|nr:hypothetical protein GHT06_010063 [Daphnia sinensis]